MSAINTTNKIYESFINKSSDGLLVADHNRQIKNINRKTEEILGYKKNELLQKTIDDIVPEKFHKECRDLCQNFLNREDQNTGKKVVVLFQRKNGTSFPAELNLSDYTDSSGNITLIGTFKDISETREILKNLKRSEKKFASVFLNSPVPMIINRKIDFQIIEVNESFLQLTGCSREEILEKKFPDTIFLKEEKDKLTVHKLLMSQSNIRDLEVILTTKNNTNLIALLSSQFLEINNESHFIMTFIDISEKKRTRDELVLLNESLETRINERTLKLMQSLEREKKLNELRSRFITTASHEFRTPLATIQSSLHLLKIYCNPEDERSATKHYNKIETAVRNLTEILDDLLSIDYLERGQIQFSTASISLKTTIESILKELQKEIKENQTIDVTYSGNENIITDSKVLSIILKNLIDNAIRFSRAGDSITVSINALPNQLIVSIKDEGIGIPEPDQPHIFNAFFRAKNAESIPGTGLGLAIVKRYLNLFGGTIEFTSAENYGSTFKFSFPIHPINTN